MYPKVLLTNHWMEDNLEIHLEEIRLEDHPFIHLLKYLNDQHLTHICLYHLLYNMYQNHQQNYHTGNYNI
jgi:hypothetical protein